MFAIPTMCMRLCLCLCLHLRFSAELALWYRYSACQTFGHAIRATRGAPSSKQLARCATPNLASGWGLESPVGPSLPIKWQHLHTAFGNAHRHLIII